MARTSRVHFGYIIAYLSYQESANFEATISHIPHITSYSPNIWQRVTNTMIEKKGKGNLTKDLQIINLIEADFNLNNKAMVRSTLKYAEVN